MKLYVQGKEATPEQYAKHQAAKLAAKNQPAPAPVAVKPPASSGVVHRANINGTKPAATVPAVPGLVSAADFEPKLTMLKTEFDKLSARGKMNFVKSGGKIIN